MTSTYKFHWYVTYQNRSGYTYSGPAGEGRFDEVRDKPEWLMPSLRANYNGGPERWDAIAKPVLGCIILNPRMNRDEARRLVDAFNEFRLREWLDHLSVMRAQGMKYSSTVMAHEENNPPVVVRGAFWVGEENGGWEFTHDLASGPTSMAGTGMGEP
jgi:hypothetical protein